MDGLDALALEYKRDYGIARRNVDITDTVNYPVGKGVVRIFGPGFAEEISDLPFAEVRTFPDD